MLHRLHVENRRSSETSRQIILFLLKINLLQKYGRYFGLCEWPILFGGRIVPHESLMIRSVRSLAKSQAHCSRAPSGRAPLSKKVISVPGNRPMRFEKKYYFSEIQKSRIIILIEHKIISPARQDWLGRS